MIKNKKYFVSPPNNESDFKELFRNLATMGAGRPVDIDGHPSGPWTAELLADAISQIEANKTGIDLRSVQLWFQTNDKGISHDNIRWLAKIFGCNDPHATAAWQAELSASNSRLAAKRRHKRNKQKDQTYPDQVLDLLNHENELSTSTNTVEISGLKDPVSLALKSEALFNNQNSLNLAVTIWTLGALIWCLAYLNGVHDVTYNPLAGLTKQVGLFWSPSWTIDRMVFVALFTIGVTELLRFWKTEGRPALLSMSPTANHVGWQERLQQSSLSYWMILVGCILIVFLFQWIGVYVQALVTGDIGQAMVDWILVAIERSDVVSINGAIVISGFANLYSCFVYWCLFIGLLLMYTVAEDFRDLVSRKENDYQVEVTTIGIKIINRIYCCTAFGLLSATCIKLNALYLISDGENIVTWLINDARAFFGEQEKTWSFFNKSPSAFITSFLVTFITFSVFVACMIHIRRSIQRATLRTPKKYLEDNPAFLIQMKNARNSWARMYAVIGMLSVNFLLLGQFVGFSAMILGTVFLTVIDFMARAQSLRLETLRIGEGA